MIRVGAVIVLLTVVAALAAPWVVPYDPSSQQLSLRLERPSPTHPFGLDELGRDIFSRVLAGARISLLVGITVVGISSIAGIVLGAIAGYFGGWLCAPGSASSRSHDPHTAAVRFIGPSLMRW